MPAAQRETRCFLPDPGPRLKHLHHRFASQCRLLSAKHGAEASFAELLAKDELAQRPSNQTPNSPRRVPAAGARLRLGGHAPATFCSCAETSFSYAPPFASNSRW